MNVIEDAKKIESLFTVDRKINLCSQYGKQDRVSKFSNRPLYDPEITLLGIYLNEIKS